jgi:hypothetical protein
MVEELQSLYDINDTHFHQLRRGRDKLRMCRATNHDPYIVDGLLCVSFFPSLE